MTLSTNRPNPSMNEPITARRVQRVRHELKRRDLEVTRVDAGSGAPVMRDYTPRRFDAVQRELDIEFALHGDGPAATWAAQAAPGQRVMIGGPRGSFIVPTDFDWHLLIGDETALPAVA